MVGLPLLNVKPVGGKSGGDIPSIQGTVRLDLPSQGPKDGSVRNGDRKVARIGS